MAEWLRTSRLFRASVTCRTVTAMETRTPQVGPAYAPDAATTPAEELPGLYRAILERVADLESLGERLEAARIRMDATAAYSRAWDEAGRGRLIALLARADRALSGNAHPRGLALRRRSLPAR
jgi:hypothetical protein